MDDTGLIFSLAIIGFIIGVVAYGWRFLKQIKQNAPIAKELYDEISDTDIIDEVVNYVDDNRHAPAHPADPQYDLEHVKMATEEVGDDDKSLELTELRLDCAAPDHVQVGDPFDLAVAIRQLASPILEEFDLPQVRSGNIQIEWPEDSPYIKLRVELDAPECTIHDSDNYTFRLYPNRDAPTYYFQLTANKAGRITIMVRVYLEDEWVGNVRIPAKVEESVTEVEMKVISAGLDTISYSSDSGVNLPELRRLIVRYFDEASLKNLCFDLQIQYDALEGSGTANKARELIEYMEQRGNLEALITLCRQERPNVVWTM